jgi:2-oxoisovalerate dehydrogenase E2 component (dihydrolipoyl transacylase)
MAPVGAPLVVLDVDGAGGEAKTNGSHTAPAKTAPQKPAPASVTAAAPAAAKKTSAPAPAKSVPHLKAVDTSPPVAAATPEPSEIVTPAMRARHPGEKPLASPAVRRRADELGIRLQYVPGSGAGGRITHGDLDGYIARGGGLGAPASSRLVQRSGEEQVKVIGLRRKIAEKMQDTKRRVPHFAYVEEVDVTELESLRVHLNNTKRPEQPKLTLLPFLMRALVNVLPEFPQINARFDDEAGVVHRSGPVHIGIATQTANGLIVPVVRHAEARDVWDSAAEIARLAQLTRDGKASRDDLSGSTITITSLGALGGVVTTPVINHPEVAIIGPNAIIERPVVRDGQIAVRKMMNISSSFDHRVVDGYDAAQFIQRVKAFLTHPATLFME